MPAPLTLLTALLLITASFAPATQAIEPPKFVFDTGETEWRGERIALPPGFAPDMKWVGEEDIRFAPGMFQAQADDFFSYVLVFLLSEDAKHSEEAIESELLTYYRGLATGVMKGKEQEVDTEKFTVDLSQSSEVTPPPVGVAGVTQYSGTIDWIEPFATQKQQTLNIEAQVWKHGERPALFLCVSPLELDQEIWTQLRKIRAAFKIEDS